MSILWSLAIVAGLLILVYLMIAGVPRVDADRPAGGGANVPRTLMPMLGTVCTVGGIAGYLSSRWPGLGVGGRTGVVTGTAFLAALGVRWIVRASFAAPSTDPEDDPRYRYQGHVARLEQAIAAGRKGIVVFEIDGQRFELSAQSIDGTPIAAGTEVVIERIDDDLATVESWAVVEQRL